MRRSARRSRRRSEGDVPTIDVSTVDLTCELERKTIYEEFCAGIKRRSEGDMKCLLGYCDGPLVSADFVPALSPALPLLAEAAIVLNSTFGKVAAWCDNEWDYSCRVVDPIKHMAKVR